MSDADFIHWPCPCGKFVKAPKAAAGNGFVCPKCGAAGTVPGPAGNRGRAGEATATYEELAAATAVQSAEQLAKTAPMAAEQGTSKPQSPADVRPVKYWRPATAAASSASQPPASPPPRVERPTKGWPTSSVAGVAVLSFAVGAGATWAVLVGKFRSGAAQNRAADEWDAEKDVTARREAERLAAIERGSNGEQPADAAAVRLPTRK